ncbi:hypothetical protein EYE40_00100 [Glaciihabitans arcticus]|uniref:Transcriptional regulator, AbiEi antitoxin, Type IV TA system n=1 Tax=Glaciihabitans arcticus TaxID=2668039 RepID=A0A4Q9GTP5_9MICO|nr:hypothetical protein [Glaciihabitans arcticus]TBN55923.1 hypothetical protein EYE40_00100 [Glaciihabitans arcticus]
MNTVDAAVIRATPVLTAHCISPGDRARVGAAARSGTLVCVTRGAYLPRDLWEPLKEDAQHRVRVLAAADVQAARGAPPIVASHLSAAALWRLPWGGIWPTTVHVACDASAGGRSNKSVVRHVTGVPDGLELIDGLRVVGLGHTVTAVAATSGFREAVVLADAALRRTEHPVEGLPRTLLSAESLGVLQAELPLRHGSARARAVAAFASGLADRPGESHSRVSMRFARIPMPELQVELRGASGRRYFADFWWEEFNHIGEFDGKSKYVDPQFLRGRTPHQVLLDEKYREDDLRAAGHGFSRWGWQTALSPRLLADQLRRAGIP